MIVGSGKFANTTFEYDCLRSTTVMMIKVNINVSNIKTVSYEFRNSFGYLHQNSN